MAPSYPPPSAVHVVARADSMDINDDSTRKEIILEAWGQGFNVGALLIIILIVLCNYRKGVLLHKLILIELLLAIPHGAFIFFKPPSYGWILSGTATVLYMSYTLHNVISWIKIRPFLPGWGGRFFIISLAAVQPYWVLETWANFDYFNNLGHSFFGYSRYLEPLVRDPWWIFTTIKLVLVINKNYDYTLPLLIRTSPRFGVMLLCMLLSIIFLITDVFVTALASGPSGINPYWRDVNVHAQLALVFKCASDAIFLDDFKSVLDRIAESALKYFANLPGPSGGNTCNNNNNNTNTNSSSSNHKEANGTGAGAGSRVTPVTSPRTRNSSSLGFRRPSASTYRFTGAQQPRHFVHISAENADGGGSRVGGIVTEGSSVSELPLARHTRDGSWPTFAAGREGGNFADQQRAIRADTTITVEENDEAADPVLLARLQRRADSEEGILSSGVVATGLPSLDHGWGKAPDLINKRLREESLGTNGRLGG
ncbi:hypothetical protein ACRE_024860 [Hapsidospora chrysogenum ATCC 11550]|uniref:Uncharacterized protein n=1 Tax=Hapsidospora chrysogenum (strain ATCC 11550 / CBS 779.69 / DSM 880 / IAM 14645 / JCM 23072 / IMI 49137) TaxID=857340 RepID=A0A086TBA4_HAPC1|nr:hypothetical protein ACRE_024860 [Hapsidospora chrysogenum ATCC 11550]